MMGTGYVGRLSDRCIADFAHDADPAAMDRGAKLFAGIQCATEAYSVADGADAAGRVSEWDEFRGLDLDKLAGRIRGRSIVDLPNVYDREEAERAGFDYRGLGRQRGACCRGAGGRRVKRMAGRWTL